MALLRFDYLKKEKLEKSADISKSPNSSLLHRNYNVSNFRSLMSSQPRSDDTQEAAEEEEVLKLEGEVREMAQKIVDYRTTLSSSLLESLKTVFSTHLLEPNPSILPHPDAAATQDSEEAEKIRLMKQKISSNVAAMPIVLNRMKEYMGRIDRLDSSILIIHPAFKSV